MSFTQIGGKMIKPDKIHQTLMDILRDPESVPVVFLGHTNGKYSATSTMLSNPQMNSHKSCTHSLKSTTL
jgi:hypothetical protein